MLKCLTILFLSGTLHSFAGAHYQAKYLISLDMKDATVKEILAEIERKSDFYFTYNLNEVDATRKTTIKVDNKSVKDILDKLFEKDNVKYSSQGKHIVLFQSKKESGEEEALTQKVKIISGIVKDSEGDPIIGASVTIRGTIRGVLTDRDGKFNIEAEPKQTLVISYIGYISKEIAIYNQTKLDIILDEDNLSLDEVVVTALGIKRESKALPYNVQTISTESITNVKDASFVNSLTGKIAGVTINASSSGIGGSTKVVMRGDKSVNAEGNNNALYVLDGIPLPDLFSRNSSNPNGRYGGVDEGDGISQLNSEDIESITILTGPSSAALYGGDAANGVIMITTKKGSRDGKPVISFSNNTDFYEPFILPEFQNSYGNRMGEFASWGEKLSKPSSFKPSKFFEVGHGISNSIGLQVGNEKNQTYVSVGSYNGRGIIHNNKLNRYNVTTNGSYEIVNKLTLGTTFMYINNESQNMLAQGDYYNPLIPLYLFPRGDDFEKYKVYERYNTEREFNTQFWPYGNQGRSMQNPYWIVNRNFNTNQTERLLIGGSLKYEINDWLTVTGRIRTDRSTRVNEIKNYASTEPLLASNSIHGSYLHSTEKNSQTYGDFIANFNKKFSDFELIVNAGTSFKNIKYDFASNTNALEFGAPLNTANIFSLNNCNLTPQYQEGKEISTQSIFISASLSYKNKYFLDLTGRNEWSSLLSNTDTKSFFYPSVGLSAIVTDIFNIPNDILSYLKVRASYAEVGNVPKSLYGITNKSYPVTSEGIMTNPDLPLKKLKFEKTKSVEAGINAKFWKNIMGLDVTIYHSDTYDQIFKFKAPPSSGYAHYYVNAGKVTNKGIEAILYANANFGKVNYRPSLTFTMNKNRISELVKNIENPITGKIMNIDHIDMGGMESFRSYLNTGGKVGDIYVNSFKRDGNGYIYVDANSLKMQADNTNLVYAGNTNPNFSMGFRNEFTYRNFTLSFLIDGRFGGRVVSITQAVMDAAGVSKKSAVARDNGGVLVNGVIMDAENYYTQAGSGVGVLSDYVYKATNIRLREASLTYTIKKSLFNNLVKGLSVSITGRNLFMIYNKAPFDPQMTTSLSSFYQGVDYFMMPSLRSYGFSVKFTL